MYEINAPKVSVMVPVYNAKEFIVECLDSILSQDYQNLELVVSDDCSTDGTQEILKTYLDDDRIKIFFNDRNLGVTKNCNQALSACSGEFIALFAGDDVMLPGKISKQITAMLREPSIVLSYHPVEIFDSESGKTLFVTNRTIRNDINSVEDILLKGGIPGGCSIMVRKNAIPAGGYDCRLNTVSDWLFQTEVLMSGHTVKINEILARYRKHAQGASQQTFSLLEESLASLDILLDKHPEKSELPVLVRKAKARYLAGEVVRQLTEDKALAFKLAKDAFSYDAANLKYGLLVIVSWINNEMPGGSTLIGGLTRKLKLFFKKFLG